MENRCPVALDPTGSTFTPRPPALRAQGPAVQVELPGGVIAVTQPPRRHSERADDRG